MSAAEDRVGDVFEIPDPGWQFTIEDVEETDDGEQLVVEYLDADHRTTIAPDDLESRLQRGEFRVV